MDADTLIRVTATDEDHDEMRGHLEDALDLPFVSRGADGIYIPNGQRAHVEAGNWLREHTERQDFVIANTLSRLPPEWPDDGDDS
ncbi:hypothetical protein [Halorientalis halophila]|uniref:hypothetical protein n=1 Tax=Halorientalis halophila TaxID=3108499 RepID=UPI00300A1D9C